jgi:hypothetical protein
MKRGWMKTDQIGAKKKLVTFHEQKRILQLITKTYTDAKIKHIMNIYNM